MKLEWDEKKNRSNVVKHGVSFEDAALVFSDPNSLSLLDEENSDVEERWVTMGRHPNTSIYVIIHTYRKSPDGEKVRIISARRATKNEMKQYYENG